MKYVIVICAEYDLFDANKYIPVPFSLRIQNEIWSNVSGGRGKVILFSVVGTLHDINVLNNCLINILLKV